MNKRFSQNSSFPSTRLRRNRMKSFSRKLISENVLTVNDLILPLFVTEGVNKKEDIPSMPAVYRNSIEELLKEAEYAAKLEIPAIAIFPHIEKDLKDAKGSNAIDNKNLVCRSIKAVKKEFPDLGIITDVALDPFTDHGHDGLIINEEVHNDETLKVLGKQALVQAEAGCDMIAPSDMMDGRVAHIRQVLDEAGFVNTQILSYAAKYASGFYGPFRDAIGSKLASGASKSTYQLDPANSDEALREVELDINEGADIVMVKPGMPYLDIVQRVKQTFNIPTFVYQVSGEYMMLSNACNRIGEKLALDHDKVILESLLSFKRAGANAILTYFAKDAAKMLK
tara:strand:- start:423 stop:1439 length:1017 start_codon:yes stop_codon:yes gene_type:complete